MGSLYLSVERRHKPYPPPFSEGSLVNTFKYKEAVRLQTPFYFSVSSFDNASARLPISQWTVSIAALGTGDPHFSCYSEMGQDEPFWNMDLPQASDLSTLYKHFVHYFLHAER